MMNRLLAVVLWLWTTWAMAQSSRTVSGRVTDAESGDPLPGATVLVKGTSEGTITDVDGNFLVKVPEENNVISVSFVGFVTQELTVGNQTQLKVALSPDLTSLDEIVVVGYGTVKKSDATGAVAVVDAKKFNKGAMNSVQDLMVGKTAGVSITSISGAPGNTSTIRIRGGSSMSASNDPLIVVDGVPLDNTPIGGSPNLLSTLNPSDIATFTILKDASATAIYGSRAANGVILITTKRGSQKFTVNYKLTTSLYTTPRKVNVYSGDEFRNLINKVYGDRPEVTSLLGDANTNWQNQIYKNAFGQDHALSFSGNTGSMPYRVSLGYNNTDGVLKTYNFERTTMAVGLDPTFLKDQLKVKINVKGMNNNNNFADQSAIQNAVSYDPTKPVYNGNTRWRGYTTWTTGGVDGESINLAPANPVAQLAMTDNTSNAKRSIGNIQFDYAIPFLKGLKANLNLGYDVSVTQGHNNVKDSTQWIYSPEVAGGQKSPYINKRRNQLLDFYLNYTKEFNNSRLDVMGGYSWAHFWKQSQDSTTNQTESQVVRSNFFETEYYLLSFFGRVNYSIADKYLITATLRDDATSRFSPKERWGLFPAVALAWHVANESWMRTSDTFSDLKLRMGYGVTGQQNLNNGNDYPYFAQYTISNSSARYRLGNQYYYTLRPEGYDANIKWETTITYNAGIDFGFFKNRITGSLDGYIKSTSDLINYVDVPVGTNFTSKVLTNVGSMVNKGVEFNINYKAITTKKVNWEIGYNAYYNHNRITKLNLNNDDGYFVPTGGIGGTTSGTIQAQKVGYPVNSFYTYQQVYSPDGKPIEDAFVDRNHDGVINSSDLYIHKKPAANVLMGFNSWLNVGNWDLTCVARVSLGNYVYNNVASNSTYRSLYSSMNFLRNTSKLADKPQFTQALNTRFSDYYVENASFFRLDNVNLAYNFNGLMSDRLNLKLSCGVQNALVITKYSGIDPEISGGLDNNFFPRTRVFLLGLNAQF